MVRTQELLEDLRRVARELGHAPSVCEYAQLGRHDVGTLRRRLGGTWRHVVERGAGLRYQPRLSYPIPSDEELRRDLRRVAALVGHPPSYSDYEELGRFNVETVKRRAGQRGWPEAVASLTGAEVEEVRRHQRLRLRYQTRAQWLGRLRRLAGELGRAPTTREAIARGISAARVRERTGVGWAEALREAGVEV